MARFPDTDPVYDAAELFRQRCLVGGASFLWPDRHGVWSPGNIEALRSAYMDHPDTGDRAFLEKWHDQLSGQPADVHRLAADVMALYCLYPNNMRAPRKLSNVAQIIDWTLADDRPDLTFLEQAFAAGGIGSAGTHYLMARPEQIAFYLEFSKAVIERRNSVDPYDVNSCAHLADELADRIRGSREARDIILHLFFPDQFERIVSQRQKRMILKTFNAEAGAYSSTDEALANIRRTLMARFDRPAFDFYDEDVARLWDPPYPPETPVPPLTTTASDGEPHIWLFQANPRLFDLSQELQQATVGDDGHWTVTRYRDEMNANDLVILWQGGEHAGIYALGKLTGRPELYDYGEDPPPWIAGQSSGRTRAWRVPYCYTTILEEPIAKATLIRHPVLRGLDVLRMAQASNFRVTRSQWDALQSLIASSAHLRPTLEDLAAKTHLRTAELEEIESLLQSKRQLILAGPPGSGKTYVGELLARYMVGIPLDGPTDEHVLLLQFHQSYSYEDFVQGIRPETSPSGALEYHVRDGLFKRLCTLAHNDPERSFVVVIDEINRGNISRIFGELLLLLEYRTKQVRLPYARPEDPPFAIPDNVFIIGTMNTADRSLTQLDFALRRRFYFYELLPVVDGEAPVLASWLSEWGAVPQEARERVLRLFLALNERISRELGQEFQIGHSYFMVDGIWNLPELARVWRHAVRPLLEEYFFSHRDREQALREFDMERLLAASERADLRVV